MPMASKEVTGRRASEDQISIISIETSEDEQYSSDHEFLVECILSEKIQDGRTLYLLDWTGYPREMATWEPPENIQDPEIIKTWEERKILQQKGVEAVFDIDAFEAQKKEFAEAKALRSRLRHEKRMAISLGVSGDGPDENEIASVYGSEQTVGSLQSPKRQSPPRPSVDERRSSARQNERQAATARAKVQKRIRSDSDSSDDEPLIARKSRASISKPAPAPTPLSKGISSPKQNFRERGAALADKIHRPGTKTGPDTQIEGLANVANRGGRGATRGGSSLLSKNVFAGGRTRRRKPTLIEMATDSSKSQKHFSQLRMVRRAELAGRQLADQAPDIEALPGGLFDPSKNSHVQPIRPGTVKRHSSAFQEDEDLSQSRQQRHQEASIQPAKPKEIRWQDIPWERRTICFWWSRNIHCEFGSSCKYLHINDLSLPVALPPDNWVEPRKLPCAFYNKPGGCNKGDSCNFLHEDAGNTATNGGLDLQNAHTLPMSSSVVEKTRICYWWFSHGNCTKGDKCKFAHILDSTRTIAVPHPAVREPCLASLRGECPDSREDCPKVHAHPSLDPEPVAPVAPMAPMVSEAPAVKLREQDVCIYWKKGQCRNSAATCRWAHTFYAETPTSNQNYIEASTQPNTTRTARPTVRFSTDISEYSADYGMPTIENTDDIIMPSPDQNSNTVPMPNPPESDATRPKSKPLDLDKSRRENDLGGSDTRLKMVIFGTDSNEHPIDVDFGELPAGSLWGKTCAKLEVIRFDQMCAAQDFYFKYKSPQQLWEGNLGIDHADSDSKMIVGQVAEHLRLGSTGLLALCEEVAILLHPASAEDWNYLGSTASSPSDLKLRYLVFDLDKLIASSTTSPALITAPGADQLLSSDEHLAPPPCRAKVVKTLYGLNYRTLRDLDYENLRPSKESRNADNFFLIFPKSATYLADFITTWLRSCRKECKVYSSQVDGAWHYFAQSSSITAGVVLVYETALASLSELPWTRDLTVQNSFLFWSIGDSTSSAPLSLHPKINGVPNLGQITITPLFPFGAAIFVTPSFLVAEPAMTYKLLKWFQTKLTMATPGSYKLVGCHDLRSYLLDLAVQKSRERDDLLKKHYHKPEKDAMASEKGLSYEDCQLRFDVFKLFVDILTNDLSSGLSAIDLDPSEDAIIPVRYAPASIDPDNEKDLVSWFAGWTILNLSTYRKFYVVGSSTKNSTRAVKMVPEIRTDIPSLSTSNMPATPSSELNGANQGGASSVSLGGNEGAAKPNEVTFAIPAKVGNSSSTGAQAEQNGNFKSSGATTPSSHSVPLPDSSLGGGTHTSTSETVSPKDKLSPDQDTTMTGDSTHPHLQVTTTMDLASAAGSAATQTPSSADIRNGMKPLPFETTDVWYQRWRADKKGWEHICVDKWERVLSLMKVPLV
ncbi:chromo domain-containing protein [Rutstroemia sp. NJR-2017a BVV2]|nr:chromo domain-containing protein [Rutstroemia sp. NJR-2017a BVV2]